MIRTFFRHLGESLKSLKRNGWMTLASTSAVTITLILVGIFLGVILNVQNLAQDIENDVNVNVYVVTGTKQKEMDSLEKELKEIPNVEKVTFSSKDEQYKKILKAMGKEWKMIEGDANPLYDVFILSTKPDSKKDKQKVIDAVAKKASALEHVQKADYGGMKTEKLLKFSSNVRLWGFAAAALLLFVAVFLISNTIRITIISRQREIQIMRLVGAKNGFIRWPFFLEGAWIGMIGAIIPVALVVLGYPKIYSVLMRTLAQSDYKIMSVNSFILQVAPLLAIIGIVIGSLGSIISMRRFLKA
ncbi:cell division transport system permease protein [Pilibacter termitis]|uniref:Cell division protein FtsX n=1 Tax=Pilibacter termitis TaxID=263852 RepID=A0A1T4KQ91_9ENTE|nr:permease-like cell division protein FtsX [Pilibacter termitis]SJZ44518.1 cell division transport system permease protein [Pilibacter termitis]